MNLQPKALFLTWHQHSHAVTCTPIPSPALSYTPGHSPTFSCCHLHSFTIPCTPIPSPALLYHPLHSHTLLGILTHSHAVTCTPIPSPALSYTPGHSHTLSCCHLHSPVENSAFIFYFFDPLPQPLMIIREVSEKKMHEICGWVGGRG